MRNEWMGWAVGAVLFAGCGAVTTPKETTVTSVQQNSSPMGFIAGRVINAADGMELWTRTFDRELKDIFAVQEEIAAAVASSLKVTLLGADERAATKSATKNTEAHNAYLQGHFYLLRRNLEDYRRAIAQYDEAIRLDPDYALAYAERSEAWTLKPGSTNDQRVGCKFR